MNKNKQNGLIFKKALCIIKASANIQVLLDKFSKFNSITDKSAHSKNRADNSVARRGISDIIKLK